MNFNMDYIKAFIKKDFFLEHGSKVRIIYEIANVFFRLVFIYLISEFLRDGLVLENGSNYFRYIFFGFCLLDIGSSVIMSVSKSIMTFKHDGTFEEMLQVPLKPAQILLLTSSYSLIVSTLKFLLYLMFAFLMDNTLLINIADISLLFLVYIFYIATCVGISMIIGALTLLYFSPIRFFAINSILSMAVSGIFFPLTQFPIFINYASYLLPIRVANEIGRSIINGASFSIDALFLILIAHILAYLIIGYLSLKYASAIAKKRGTLLYY